MNIRWRSSRSIIGRYLLRETARPLLLTLLVTLTALVMERTLRLVELVSSQSGQIDMVFSLAFFLVPHYIGLALPAAFFIALLSTIARFDADNELSAIGAAGVSLAQLVRPLVFTGALLGCFSMVLFGYLQPYSRYLYREIRHVVSYTGWDLRVSPSVFISPDDNLTVHAENVDATGRDLDGIFIVQRGTSSETVIVAARAQFRTNPQQTRLILVLEDGNQTIFPATGPPLSVDFSTYQIARDFSLEAPPFRPRGNSERELTATELYALSQDPAFPLDARREAAAEIHSRIVRAVSMPVLPLLAVAMAVAARRSGRGAGMIVGGVILVAFHHTLQLGESLVDRGTLTPLEGLWGPFTAFTAFSVWAFYTTNTARGETPFSFVVAFLHRTTARLTKRRPVRRADQPA